MLIYIELFSCTSLYSLYLAHFYVPQKSKKRRLLPIIPLILEVNHGSTFKTASSSYIARIPEPVASLKIATQL